MKHKRLFPTVLVALLSAGCNDAEMLAPEDAPLVVQAYLFAGEPVREVIVRTSVALGSDSTEGAPVDDAEVTLTKAGKSWRLQRVDSAGAYGYLGDDLEVRAGDRFSLEVRRNQSVVTGETTVPGAIGDVLLSKPTLTAPVFSNGRPTSQPTLDTLSVTWSNPSAEYVFVTITAADSTAEAIFPDQIANRLGSFRLRLQPTRNAQQLISILSLQQTGEHEVTVYRVNQEYADLYDNRTQDSRNLNEPPSNLRGGLGVFTAFNGGARMRFSVVRATR